MDVMRAVVNRSGGDGMRRVVQVVAILCTLIVGAASITLIVSQTAWFKDWLRGFIVRQADDYLNGRLRIGRLGGNLFFGVELEDIDLTLNGQPVVSVKNVGVQYSVLDFLGGGIVLDSIRLNQPVVRLEKTDRGWTLGQLLKKQRKEADREGPGRPIRIGEIGITGWVVDTEGRGGNVRCGHALAHRSTERARRLRVRPGELHGSDRACLVAFARPRIPPGGFLR